MANVNVPTTPPGVTPVQTVAISDVTYAQVEADVLRRKPGEILEGAAARDQADMVLRAGYAAPAITLQPTDETVTITTTDATFDITVTGSPTPEVEWQVNHGDGVWRHVAFITDLVIDKDEATLAMDGWEYRAVVKNYKGTVVSDVVVLTVAGA